MEILTGIYLFQFNVLKADTYFRFTLSVLVFLDTGGFPRTLKT